MLIEKVDFELEALAEADLILVILEICSVECLVVDLAEVEQGERQEVMTWKNRSKSVLKRLFCE